MGVRAYFDTPKASSNTVVCPSITYIDPNQLLGESVVAGLSRLDDDTNYEWHPNVADWLSTGSSSSMIVLREVSDCIAGLGIEHEIVALKRAFPEALYVIFSDNPDCKNIIHYLSNGARGYILTDSSLHVSAKIIHLILAGGIYFPAFAIMKMIDQSKLAKSPSKNIDGSLIDLLTLKEVSVVKKLSQGAPNKTIAYDLNICESTVKVHVRKIMRKLGARNRTQVAFITNAIFAEAV